MANRSERQEYCSIHIGALTGSISAEHLVTADHPNRGYTQFYSTSITGALRDLAEGGYVIDNTVIADHPNLVSWVMRAPLQNGKLEGDEVRRMPQSVRQSAKDMAPFMEGEFAVVAQMMAVGYGESSDGQAGAFDEVSAAYIAAYWASRGAKVGKRVGNTLVWNDGSVEAITPREEQRT